MTSFFETTTNLWLDAFLAGRGLISTMTTTTNDDNNNDGNDDNVVVACLAGTVD